MPEHPYSIVIQWSEIDRKFIVHLPEFGPYAHTHGNTYTEALRHALEVLELLIEDYTARGQDLPLPLSLERGPAIADASAAIA